MRFKNKVVWITGASSGIGAALASQLAAGGALLVLTARNRAALNAVKEKCIAAGGGAAVLPADMLQPHTLCLLTEQAIAIFGRIDIVIFSAGQSQRSYASNTEMPVYRHLMELNYFAPVALTRALLPHFSERRSGHIVAISSMAGLMGFPLRSGYAAAKHALKGFFETLQTETPLSHLAITLVSPGRINTPISLAALTGTGSPHGHMDKGQQQGIPAERCAQKIIAAILAKKRHVLIAQNEKLLWWLWWFARPLYYKIAKARGNERSS